MLIDHPSGMFKQFRAASEEPTEISAEEIADVATQLDDIFGQSDVHVAILVADNFPDAKVKVRGTENSIEFTYFYNEKLLLSIDETGWKIEGEELGWKWEDIKEGNPPSVAESILRDFAEKRFLVYYPPKTLRGRKNRRIMTDEN